MQAVVEIVSLGKASIPWHLDILSRGGVVNRRRAGYVVFYRVVDSGSCGHLPESDITMAGRELSAGMAADDVALG